MIAYFDTSAIVPLIVHEPASRTCRDLWNDSARVVTSRVMYAEASAALAQAQRLGRLSQTAQAMAQLVEITADVDHIEVSTPLVERAGALAHVHALRGYDAIHLASATVGLSDAFVLVTGDLRMAQAARDMGLATAVTS